MSHHPIGEAPRDRSHALSLPFALGVVVVAWPTEPELVGVSFVALFAAATTGAFRLAYRRGALLTALFIALNTLAFGVTLGDAVQDGIRRDGLVASASSVRLAVALLLVFLLGTTLVSLLAQRRLRRAPHPDRAADHARGFVIALVVFFLACAFAAFGSGAWTHWRGNDGGAASGGGLELLYPTMLFVAFGVVALPGPDGARRGPRLIRLVVWLALAVLVFALQSRRIMFACGIVVALAALRYPPPSLRRITGLNVGVFVRMATLGALLLLALVASAGWRSAASRGEVGFASGLGSAVSAAIAPGDFDARLVEGRMTYLWMDSITLELRDSLGLEMSVGGALESAVLIALPAMLNPNKGGVVRETCEAPFSGVGVIVDLPCTPTAEAYLSLGAAGLVPLVLLWGLYLGLADAMIHRWTRLGRVAGLALFAPAISIEVGLFPMVQGIRGMVFAVAAIAALAVIADAAIGRRAGGAGPDNSAAPPHPRPLSPPTR